MTLLSRKRLMGLSLIALAAFSACTDDVDVDRDTGLAGRRLSFIVSLDGEEAQTKADDSGNISVSRLLGSVELKDKQGGKSAYLQAEETDGFPGDELPADGQPLTRGTQINTATHMDAFAVSAYTSLSGTPDHMYNVKVVKKSSEWNPEGDYKWPDGKKLHFYAWHPYQANSLSVTDQNTTGAPVLTYAVPEAVAEQQDVMTAIKYNQSDGVGGTRLEFKHALSAVRFVTGSSLSSCTLHYIKLTGLKYKGTRQVGTSEWKLDADKKDYTLTLEKKMDGKPNVPITEGDQTLLLMPQAFENDVTLEVSMTVGKYTYQVGAKLKDVTGQWKAGKTYTYKLSDTFSDILKVDVNFFKGTGYTAHNVSANGDPYTIDITYPSPNRINKMQVRFAYSNNEVNGWAFDLNGQTRVENGWLWNANQKRHAAQESRQYYLVQIKIQSDVEVEIQAPHFNEGRLVTHNYKPVQDDDRWFNVWYGMVYPPNYVDEVNRVIISRADAYRSLVTHDYADSAVKDYSEIDNHPYYGKGKWGFPDFFGSDAAIQRGYGFFDCVGNGGKAPHNNSIYGDPVSGTFDTWVWTSFSCGYAYNGSPCYWAIRNYGNRYLGQSYYNNLPKKSYNHGDGVLTPYGNTARAVVRCVKMY